MEQINERLSQYAQRLVKSPTDKYWPVKCTHPNKLDNDRRRERFDNVSLELDSSTRFLVEMMKAISSKVTI